MSQKTNPLSLRLQRKGGNHHFSSPWFTDVFFSDTFQYESSIRKYIDSLLEETQHSKAFFSVKNSYRKFNVMFSIQDTRAQKKEKQLLFNLKSNLSNDNKKQSVIRNATQQIKKGYFFTSPFTEGDKVKAFAFAEGNGNGNSNGNGKSLSENKSFSNFFRKRVRDNFLQFKQNYNFKNFSQNWPITVTNISPLQDESVNISSLTLQNKVLHKGFAWDEQLFLQSDVLLSLPLPPAKAKAFTLSPSVKGDAKDDRLYLKDAISSYFVRATKNHFQDRIKNRNCLTFCEKIINGENLKYRENQYNFPTFGNTLISDKNFATFLHNIKFKTSNFLYTPTLKKAIINFSPIRFVNATQSVSALLDQIVVLLEKRVSFREIKLKLFKDVEKNYLIKGIRFSCSGRLGGRSKKAQKAKMQSYQWGETSLNAFSSKVVFANKSAMTPYGKVGVKIWLSFKTNTR